MGEQIGTVWVSAQRVKSGGVGEGCGVGVSGGTTGVWDGDARR